MKLLGLLVAICVLIICVPAWLALVGGIVYAFLVTEGPLKALGMLVGLIAISLIFASAGKKPAAAE